MKRIEDSESGFTLVETLVAMVIAAVLAAVVAGVLISALRAGNSSAQRTVASNIASGQIEALRAQRAIDLPDGRTTKSVTGTDGTVYAVTTDTALLQSSGDASVCSVTGNGRVAFKRLRVTVDWPTRGATQPVTIDTTKALGIGSTGLDATKGLIAIYVLGGANQTMAGVPVTLTPGGVTVTTGADGCAVFPNLAASSAFSASLSLGSYVGPLSTQVSSSSAIGVFANQVSRLTMRYDLAGGLAPTVQAAPGAMVPANLGFSVSYGGWQPGTKAFPVCAVSTPCVTNGSIGSLFPDTLSSYQIWPGTCDDARPSSPAAKFVTTGSPTAVIVPIGSAQISVVNAAQQVQPGSTVYVKRQSPPAVNNGGCVGETYTFTTDANGGVLAALPPGGWTISAKADYSSSTSLTVPASGTVATATKVTK